MKSRLLRIRQLLPFFLFALSLGVPKPKILPFTYCSWFVVGLLVWRCIAVKAP